jgi:hypothetical protein
MQTLVWAFSEGLGAAYLDLRDTCVDWIEVIVLMYDWMSFWKVGGWLWSFNTLFPRSE